MKGYGVPRAGQVRITGGFFKHYMDLIIEKALPYQWQVLNGALGPNPTVRNFRIAAGEMEGAHEGVPYQDTDLAKWLDAVGCALADRELPSLEATADAIIETIVRAQDEDGYLDTYYQLVCPGEKWTDPESHELYCFGHMIEAGVSYYEGTGKKRLLEVACRLADHVRRVFGPGPEQMPGYRGHEIIEMALVRLMDVTGNAAYGELAGWFVHARAQHPEHFYQDTRREGNPLDYGCWGWGDPERELSSYAHVTGHAVRAMYLYAGMADVARIEGDAALSAHCRSLFHDVADSQMYITGGIGTTAMLEAYTYPYDLPNDTMYAETCASIGLCFFAQRLLRMENHRPYADVMERCLYNILPASVAQDGRHYFYVNPLEVDEEACARSPLKTHVKPQRQPWYECACCPPNLARMFGSLPRYLYTVGEDGISVHLYADSEGTFSAGGEEVSITQKTDYPFSGDIELRLSVQKPVRMALRLRIPEWCGAYAADMNGVSLASQPLEDGYLLLDRLWEKESTVSLTLPMGPMFVQAHPKVRKDCGKVALQRGPVVYCAEEADNGALLNDLSVESGEGIEENLREDVPGFGAYAALTAGGSRSAEEVLAEQRLYFPQQSNRQPAKVVALPYCLWGERTPGEMLIWLEGR